MKHIHSIVIATTALFLSIGTARSQENDDDISDESPIIPVGSLSAFPTIVQTGTHPTLTWSVTIPETVEELIEIIPPGTIIPKRDLIMDVRMLGAGVTVSSSSSSQGFYFVPIQVQINYNGSGYSQIFYGDNNDVNPNQIIHTIDAKVGDSIDFGSRYYYNNQWGQWYSTTNDANNVVALKNGDTPPTTTPMHNAPTIESFILPYIGSDGKMVLGPREVIYLMELTHNDSSHSGFDLQDAAILVGFYDAVAEDSAPVDTSTSTGTGNNGHGNNDDGVDSSNPGSSKSGQDSDPLTDDEKKRGRRKK
tara:strand:+ start:493 stop:1410 length:918 start_codon:yes stop_codon:yes gene_type:complete